MQQLSNTKLANSDAISKNLPKKDQDSFLELHNKIGFDALSMKEWTKYYRLAVSSVLDNPESIDQYMQVRKAFLQSKNISINISRLLNEYPILMTEIETEAFDTQSDYNRSLGDDNHIIPKEENNNIINVIPTKQYFASWTSSEEDDIESQKDIINARKNSE